MRIFVCGTKATVRIAVGDYRVVCATCGGGGTIQHRTAACANAAAVRDSARACRKCGAH